jgi:CDP-glucose 4,6-dehydratase
MIKYNFDEKIMPSSNSIPFWSGKSVFVTGANGFLGSWICQELVARGGRVVGLVRDALPQSYLCLTGTDRKINLVQGELENPAVLERTIHEFEVDTIFHLGAQPIVTIANRHPVSTFESNIRGTWNLLEAARKSPLVRRVVVASSDKAYGSKEKMPYSEDASLEGLNPYDFSKTATDMLAQVYHRSYGLPVTISRCGNFFGPGDPNFSRIVPGTIQSLERDERPVIRSNGKYLRDYFYIEDVVGAYLLLAENTEKMKGEAFNFGTEQPTSVIDIVNRIIKISGKKHLKPKILGTARGEIPVQYLSCKKAHSRLGWNPKTGLDEALELTYRWYRDFLGGL